MATYLDLKELLRSVQEDLGLPLDRTAGERLRVRRLRSQLLNQMEGVVSDLEQVELGAVLDPPSEAFFFQLERLATTLVDLKDPQNTYTQLAGNRITAPKQLPRFGRRVIIETLQAAYSMRQETPGRRSDQPKVFQAGQDANRRYIDRRMVSEAAGTLNIESPLSKLIFGTEDKPRHGNPPRYANATLFHKEQPLNPQHPLSPDAVVLLRLDIGELSRESQVEHPEPFPDQLLPDEDLWIDVMVSSSHFAVGMNENSLEESSAAHGRFLLPRDGGPARTTRGRPFLFFSLRAPQEPRRGARARVGYYFRGAVVQSQVLIADVGVGEGFRITNDFTVSARLDDLGAIRERPRLSVFVNEGSGGSHQLSVRSEGRDGKGRGLPIEVSEATVGGLVSKMRTALRDLSPAERRQGRDKLINDLRKLAPLGWNLYTAVPGKFGRALNTLRDQAREKDAILQVARSSASGFHFPWTLIYEYSIDSQIPSERLEPCPLIDRWNGRDPLFEGAPRECPEAGNVPHEDLLCPFGFWGFRYRLEQIVSSDRPISKIPVASAPEMVVGETQYGVDRRELADHVKQLRTILTTAFPGATLQEGKDKAAIRSLLGKDLPLVYFYCHGEKLNITDPNPYLGVGDREQITAGDFIGWVKDWFDHDRKTIWDKVCPLVFVNACHSLEINPNTLASYLEAFIGAAGAAGVIGTEVRVEQKLAMQFAQSFFERFVDVEGTVDRALRQVRFDFLREGNLFGLLYTPYCWADLSLAR
jgi:hypothetical protein